MYYDREGRPIEDGSPRWAALFSDRRYKIVCHTHLREPSRDCPVLVSTVWLGLDHEYGNGPPLIFETMVFGHTEWDEAQDRYPTEAKAIDGHLAWVDRVLRENPALEADPDAVCGCR